MDLKKLSAAFITCLGSKDMVGLLSTDVHVDSSGKRCLVFVLIRGKNFFSVSGSVPYCFNFSLSCLMTSACF